MQKAFRLIRTHNTAKHVADWLAWHHNDATRRCDPSIATLCEETCLSDRAVQQAIRQLESEGHISVIRTPGQRSHYLLHPRTTFTPEGGSPPNDVHPTPEGGSPLPPKEVRGTPERRSPERERTTISTGRKPESTPPAAKEEEVKPEKEKRPKPGPDPEACATTLPGKPSAELMEAWGEWQQYRQRRAIAPGRQRVAWTAQAARLSAKQVTQYAASHGDRLVCDRIASAINGEWQGLNLDKLEAHAYKPAGKMSREEEARMHTPNPNTKYGF